ncbi:MAG TPA: 4Fe-4S binding protein [Thermoanaerobacterales bacterium]|jgi:2-oxoglutarate ferredoxin oxidoreductase subunit delta|nr:4Fe-4S binding protein [Thermoanaerobacterales bacterium]
MVSNANFEIIINEKTCKRCGLCIAFCPKKVYTADDDGKPIPTNLDACIKCKLCELRCPDYAIVVGGDE